MKSSRRKTTSGSSRASKGEPVPYPKEEIKAGIIVVSAVAILTVFTVLVGGGRFFESFDIYHVHVKNAAGIETGAQVKLGGVRVGRVLSVTPPHEPGAPVTIQIGLKKNTPVYEGTRAVITQVGFVGDIYMLLSVRETTEGLIKPGSVIPSEDQVEFGKLMAQVDRLSGSVDALIKDINKLFSNKNLQGIERLVENLNELTTSGSANISRMSRSFAELSEKTQVVLSEVEEILRDSKGDVKEILAKTREDLDKAKEMMAAIEEASKNVGRTAVTVDRSVDAQSQNLDTLLTTMNKTLEDLRDLLQELKHKPWSVIYREKGKER